MDDYKKFAIDELLALNNDSSMTWAYSEPNGNVHLLQTQTGAVYRCNNWRDVYYILFGILVYKSLLKEFN